MYTILYRQDFGSKSFLMAHDGTGTTPTLIGRIVKFRRAAKYQSAAEAAVPQRHTWANIAGPLYAHRDQFNEIQIWERVS